MTMETRLIALAQAIGADIKDLNAKRGLLSSLNTTDKTSIVAAINEIVAALASAGASINDTAGDGNTTETWSANKIFDEIAAAKDAVTNSLVNGAAATLDTLNELAAALGNDPNYAATIATALTKRIRVDAAQSFTGPEQLQACQNIGVGNPEVDLVATYNTAKA